MPFFSIITPTYNRAQLIGKTIESVLRQDFEDFELIIVDDGSTDNTKELVADFKDIRIRYFHQKNGERGKARNRGVKEAKGEYVFFLDSDDLIYTDHLKHAYENIMLYDSPAFFHSRYEAVFDTTKKQVESLNQATLLKKISRQNKFACQFFLNRSLALDYPFSENRNLKIGEDWEVILKIAYRYPLHFSNKVTAAIVHHSERSMEIADSKTILESRNILLENLKVDLAIPETTLQNVFAELTTLAALSAAISNNKKQAFKLWREGIRTKPRLIFTRRTLAIFKKILFHGKA